MEHHLDSLYLVVNYFVYRFFLIFITEGIFVTVNFLNETFKLRSSFFLNTFIILWRSDKVRAHFPLDFFTMGGIKANVVKYSGMDMDSRDTGIIRRF